MALKTVLLCCGGKNCPTLSTDGNDVIVKDDHGGLIILTKEQALHFSKFARKLLKEPKS